MILYRPVGLEELRLIFETGMTEFPPRLPEQPIFYPVLNEDYAAQIARDWNTKSHSFVGYVTRFSVSGEYAMVFPTKTVGARQHQELWVPSERLGEFNRQLTARIVVIQAFFGEQFDGLRPTRFALKGKNAAEQFVALAGIFAYSLLDFHGEVAANREAVFLHFSFWKHRDFQDSEISNDQRDAVLDGIRRVWSEVSPEIPLADC